MKLIPDRCHRSKSVSKMTTLAGLFDIMDPKIDGNGPSGKIKNEKSL